MGKHRADKHLQQSGQDERWKKPNIAFGFVAGIFGIAAAVYAVILYATDWLPEAKEIGWPELLFGLILGALGTFYFVQSALALKKDDEVPVDEAKTEPEE